MILLLVLALSVLGVPLFAVLALLALGTYWQLGFDPILAVMEFVGTSEAPALAALPLFAFTAILLAHSKVPTRLAELGNSALGKKPACLSLFVLMLCALMTAFSGAPGITALVLAGLLMPGLVQAGYSERVSLGMLHAGSGIGLLIAPSLMLIVYAIIGQQIAPRADIDPRNLFLAAALPGLLMLALMTGYMVFKARSVQVFDSPPRKAIFTCLRENLWELPLPFAVLGGIYSGRLQLLEVATISAAWILFSLVVIRREIKFSQLPALINRSMILVAGIMLVLSLSIALATVLMDAGVMQRLFEWIAPYIDSRLGFLLLISLILLAAGLLLDGFALVLIFAPIVIPLALDFGVDPLHLGVVYLASLQLGCLVSTPGFNSILAGQHHACDKPNMAYTVLPFLGLLMLGLLLIIIWPGLSLALPGLLGS